MFLAGAILLQFFVILSGGVSSDPENKFYYLAADTRNLGNAPSMSAWTFFAVCPVNAVTGTSTTYGCRGAQAALPFNPPQNFGYTTGGPAGFLG